MTQKREGPVISGRLNEESSSKEMALEPKGENKAAMLRVGEVCSKPRDMEVQRLIGERALGILESSRRSV